METRNVNLQCTKRIKAGNSFKAYIPTIWIRDMGLSEDDRKINISYDDTTKTIFLNK